MQRSSLYDADYVMTKGIQKLTNISQVFLCVWNLHMFTSRDDKLQGKLEIWIVKCLIVGIIAGLGYVMSIYTDVF